MSSKFGGDERNRTADPLLARQVLSQLSYTPIYDEPLVFLKGQSLASGLLLLAFRYSSWVCLIASG